MDANDLELRLSGTGVPDGEIGLDHLAGVAHALQLLATRIGRHLRPGRPRADTRCVLAGDNLIADVGVLAELIRAQLPDKASL